MGGDEGAGADLGRDPHRAFWKRGGICLTLVVDKVGEEGWETLADLAGPEAVEIAKRHKGRKVVVLSEADYRRAFPATPSADPSAVLFGPRVYRITTPPEIRLTPRHPSPLEAVVEIINFDEMCRRIGRPETWPQLKPGGGADGLDQPGSVGETSSRKAQKPIRVIKRLGRRV